MEASGAVWFGVTGKVSARMVADMATAAALLRPDESPGIRVRIGSGGREGIVRKCAAASWPG